MSQKAKLIIRDETVMKNWKMVHKLDCESLNLQEPNIYDENLIQKASRIELRSWINESKEKCWTHF